MGISYIDPYKSREYNIIASLTSMPVPGWVMWPRYVVSNDITHYRDRAWEYLREWLVNIPIRLSFSNSTS